MISFSGVERVWNVCQKSRMKPAFLLYRSRRHRAYRLTNLAYTLLTLSSIV